MKYCDKDIRYFVCSGRLLKLGPVPLLSQTCLPTQSKDPMHVRLQKVFHSFTLLDPLLFFPILYKFYRAVAKPSRNAAIRMRRSRWSEGSILFLDQMGVVDASSETM